MYKIIYIDRISDHTPGVASNITYGDNYFTIGWGAGSARKFKEYNPDIKVECWKTDHKAETIYERDVAGVKFRIFPAINIKHFGDYSRPLLRHLKNELNKDQALIFNISSFRHLLFYSVAFKLKDYPLVVQNNGESTAIYKVMISRGIKKIFYWLQTFIEKRALRNIDLLYILDERLKNYLPPTKAIIKKQTLGIMPERFTPLSKKEARKLLNLDPDKKYLLYIGKLNYTKRSDVLIDIYRDLKNLREDLELLIVGTTEKDPLIKYALNAGAKVNGRVLHTDVYKYLSAADVYILAKYSAEHAFGGIGLLPLEALLCNAPIIGGSLENFPEEFRDKVGFAVSEADEIKKAILNVIDGQVSFKNLREITLSHYSWENISIKTMSDYNALLHHYYKPDTRV